MKNQNIMFALGDENQTSISGTERNVSVTVEKLSAAIHEQFPG